MLEDLGHSVGLSLTAPRRRGAESPCVLLAVAAVGARRCPCWAARATASSATSAGWGWDSGRLSDWPMAPSSRYAGHVAVDVRITTPRTAPAAVPLLDPVQDDSLP